MKLLDTLSPVDRLALEREAKKLREIAAFRKWLFRVRARAKPRPKTIRSAPLPDLTVQRIYRDEMRYDDFGDAYKVRILHHTRLVGW
jgi:hypothetical protein